jgi:hypothetical protein
MQYTPGPQHPGTDHLCADEEAHLHGPNITEAMQTEFHPNHVKRDDETSKMSLIYMPNEQQKHLFYSVTLYQ